MLSEYYHASQWMRPELPVLQVYEDRREPSECNISYLLDGPDGEAKEQ